LPFFQLFVFNNILGATFIFDFFSSTQVPFNFLGQNGAIDETAEACLSLEMCGTHLFLKAEPCDALSRTLHYLTRHL